MLNNTIVFFTT